MAHIRVNRKQLERTASAIETYISKHKSRMGNIDGMVASLGTSWQGDDYTQLKKEWEQIEGANSTSDQMIKSLKNYADYLRFAGRKYKQAQNAAIDRAQQKLRL